MNTAMEYIIDHPRQLEAAAKDLLAYLGTRKKAFFYGPIGAGKTALIKAICKQLGVQAPATSPTYSLINQYAYIPAGTTAEQVIYHIDLYRLKSTDEALQIGIEDCLYGPDYCFVEWPKLVEPLLPDNTAKIYIEILENSSRKLLFL